MIKEYVIKGDVKHLSSTVQSVYSPLCGLSFDDRFKEDNPDAVEVTYTTKGPVTCPDCAEQILACRGVRIKL